MDKSNHTVTIPRGYLEMLEKSFEEAHEPRKENLEGFIAREVTGDLLIIRCNKLTDRRFLGVAIIDNDGREMQRFIKPF